MVSWSASLEISAKSHGCFSKIVAERPPARHRRRRRTERFFRPDFRRGLRLTSRYPQRLILTRYTKRTVHSTIPNVYETASDIPGCKGLCGHKPLSFQPSHFLAWPMGSCFGSLWQISAFMPLISWVYISQRLGEGVGCWQTPCFFREVRGGGWGLWGCGKPPACHFLGFSLGGVRGNL